MTIARTTRAGTRNFAREEIKRVKKQLEKVRKWEKKWVVLEECGLKVYRWVPKPMTAVSYFFCQNFFLYFSTPIFFLVSTFFIFSDWGKRTEGLAAQSRPEAEYDAQVCWKRICVQQGWCWTTKRTNNSNWSPSCQIRNRYTSAIVWKRRIGKTKH